MEKEVLAGHDLAQVGGGGGLEGCDLLLCEGWLEGEFLAPRWSAGGAVGGEGAWVDVVRAAHG